MRLLRTTDLTFAEFYEAQLPQYGILSHRWGPVEEEVSYTEFRQGLKRSTTGYAKITTFCSTLKRAHNLESCWVDTCCIDQSSSAELTEAINSMFRWYENAVVCYAYLVDFPSKPLSASDWFRRGWTLQELLAPSDVWLFDNAWNVVGTRQSLARVIAQITGIDESLLARDITLQYYSVAQKMSWAAHRTTTRREDEAYCLLGLFDVNMPLLYGEGAKAFRRLQEEILASGEDTSVFAWYDDSNTEGRHANLGSLLAPSPAYFAQSGNVRRGFSSHRILFEKTNRGMMVLIHLSYDPAALARLLELSSGFNWLRQGSLLGITIPLGCYRPTHESHEAIFLRLVLGNGKWWRLDVTSHYDEHSMVGYTGTHFALYKNEYVRFYVHHDMPDTNARDAPELFPFYLGHVQFIDIRDQLVNGH